MKKAQHVEAIVSHHGLIRLVVSYGLTQQQSSWEELIAMIEGGLTEPSPKRRHSISPPEQPEKRRENVASTSQQPELHQETAKRKHAVDSPEQPEEPRKSARLAQMRGSINKPRKSARLARIRGRLETLQGSTSQPVIIEDEQPEEEAPEPSGTEIEAETEQEEEMGQQEDSPLQDLLGDDDLAAVLANMSKYGQPSSSENPHDQPQEENMPVHDEEEENTEREQSVPMSQEENLEEVGAETAFAQEESEPVEVHTPEQPEQSSEEEPEEEELATGHDPVHHRQTAVPSKETMDIKKLRKERTKLLNTITQLRQQIRILKKNQKV